MGRSDASLTRFGRLMAEAQDEALRGTNPLAGGERLLASLRAPARPASRDRWRGGAVVSALALAAAVVLYFAVRRPLTFVIEGSAAIAGVGVPIVAPDTAPAPVRFSDGTRVTLEPRTRARVTSIDAAGAWIVLDDGAAAVEVVPGRRGRWSLNAGPFELRVTGTAFVVRWDAPAERFELRMNEGALTVAGPLVGERRVVAGDVVRAALKDGKIDVLPATADGLQPSATAAAPPPEPEPAPASPGPSSAPAHPTPAAPSWRALIGLGKYREALAAAEAAGFDAECNGATAAELMKLADAARYAGKVTRSIQASEALRRRFPGDSRAAVAAFLLGKMAFDNQGAYATSAKWFATYLREQPGGSLAREAAGRLIEAKRRSGDAAGAREAARQYLARYPQGPHAELARSLAP